MLNQHQYSPTSSGKVTVDADPGIPLVENGKYPTYSGKGKVSKYRTDNVGWRLSKRKELFARKRRAATVSLVLAMAGILFMVLHVELTINKIYPRVKPGQVEVGSVLLKLCITLTTLCLLAAVVWYHIIDVKLFMVDNSLDDWRLAMSSERVARLVTELVVCVVHPPPGNLNASWVTYNSNQEQVIKTIPFDVVLALPMFARFYLICRVILLNSRLFTDARSQSLGALNQISFDFKFIFKSAMTMYPEAVLVIVMGSIFLLGSWAMRACEMYHNDMHANFFNSMWLVAITYLTIGYGDITPTSYCGRAIAVTVGMMGTFCTALVVAVLARKLEMSRAEKYVHSFVVDIELDKNYKHAAADILREGWMIYKNKKRQRAASVRAHQRKLLQAIHRLRDIKTEQRRMMDGAVTIMEMARTQELMANSITQISHKQEAVQASLNAMDEKFNHIDTKLNHLHAILTQSQPRR